MRRRDFITLVGGTAAWPLAAWAQQPERMRRVGVLYGVSEAEWADRMVAFRRGLAETGFIRQIAGGAERGRGRGAKALAWIPWRPWMPRFTDQRALILPLDHGLMSESWGA